MVQALVDAVAKALARQHSENAIRQSDWKLFVPKAEVAIAVFARWLREPSEETVLSVVRAFHCAPDGEQGEFATAILRALASHLEERK